MDCGRSRSGELLLRGVAIWPRDLKSLACASVNTSGAAFDSFNVAAERQIGRYGDKPFLTWYDDHRDERIELSYRTFDNWVAKTANLLVDELGAEPGDRVGAVLVDHWQTPVVLAACWRAGMRRGGNRPGVPRPADKFVCGRVRARGIPGRHRGRPRPDRGGGPHRRPGRPRQPRPGPGAQLRPGRPQHGGRVPRRARPRRRRPHRRRRDGHHGRRCWSGRRRWPTGPASATATGCCRAGRC